jgi:hypothetical protein
MGTRPAEITYPPQAEADANVCNPAPGGCRTVVIHRLMKGHCDTQTLLLSCRFSDFEPLHASAVGRICA